MRTSFDCPICGASEWVKGQEYVARRDRVNTGSPLLQYNVLFDVWFPCQPEVTLRSISCDCCGFITYAPRPDEEDMVAKYQSLINSDPLGAPHPSAAPTRLGTYMDKRRALRGFLAATRSSSRLAGSVLDVGGGDGRLLRPFIDHGFDSFVIDHYPAPITGVVRLGSTIRDLSSAQRFDVILCNHFLEHVVDPRGVLEELANHVTPNGLLCVEVPDEVWGGLPLPRHAPIHVNYFTKRTTEILLKLSGWRPIWSKTGAGSYGEVAIAATNIVAQADPMVSVSDAEYAAASRDSQMRLHADSELVREHFQVLASRVRLQVGCMLGEGHVIANARAVFNRAMHSIKARG